MAGQLADTLFLRMMESKNRDLARREQAQERKDAGMARAMQTTGQFAKDMASAYGQKVQNQIALAEQEGKILAEQGIAPADRGEVYEDKRNEDALKRTYDYLTAQKANKAAEATAQDDRALALYEKKLAKAPKKLEKKGIPPPLSREMPGILGMQQNLARYRASGMFETMPAEKNNVYQAILNKAGSIVESARKQIISTGLDTETRRLKDIELINLLENDPEFQKLKSALDRGRQLYGKDIPEAAQGYLGAGGAVDRTGAGGADEPGKKTLQEWVAEEPKEYEAWVAAGSEGDFAAIMEEMAGMNF